MKSHPNRIGRKEELYNIGIRFYFVRILKWLIIFFKWKKKLKEIEFNYYKNWHFENAYLIIHCKFLNAIWIDVNSVKRIYSNTPIILNLQNINSNNINVVVHGFLSKRKYTISVNKEDRLNSQFFKTETLQISTISNKASVIKNSITAPILNSNKPKLTYKSIKVFDKTIQINHNKFKLQDYL